MADDVPITAGTGTIVATDEIGGRHHQRVKVGHGVNGAYVDASAAAPLPVGVATGGAVGSARVTVAAAGTRVQLAAHAALGVTVRASSSNAGLVYVGGATVAAANGFDLGPGEAVSVDVADTAALYVDAQVSGDAVSYLWVAL